MEINHHYLLLLFFLLILTMLTTTTTNSQPFSPSPSPSPSASASPATALEQLNKIIDALIGASDFNTWVSILSMTNPTLLPISATLFIPQDNTFSSHNNNNNKNNNHPPLDPFLFPYHVIPQRLTFSDLLLLPPTTRLPTLLPDRSISVTLNSAGNFSLDDTPLTHPDLYATPSLAVHGVANLLDYSLFGHGIPSPPLSQPFMPIEWKSGAAAAPPSFWCTRLDVVLFIFYCSFLIQRLIAL